MEHIRKFFSRSLFVKFLVLLALTPVFTETQAQFTDDFLDGDFTANPSWTGDTENFVVNAALQLQLNAEGEGRSCLVTENPIAGEAEWQFWVKFSFSPSANNNARVYLISDHDTLHEPLSGYFIQLGEPGADDALELFRQDGSELTSICRGTEGLIAASFQIRIKITRNSGGFWRIYVDPSGGIDFQLDASGTDEQYIQSEYFGIFCKYTSSNSKKMYFDDFYVGPVQHDSIPPGIDGLTIETSNRISVLFSEGVDQSSAENTNNYLLTPGNIYPVHCILDEENNRFVHLQYQDDFQSGQGYLLTINNVEDYSGNTMHNQTASFSYYTASVADVVINEVMADPGPPVGLPEYEYIELANNTEFEISLKGWSLSIGNSKKIFDNVTMKPGGYLILGKESAEAEMSTFGDFYGFSGFSLTNSGQTLVLRNPEGNLISTISYKESWYKDEDKSEGGWSLEQIDPYNPCAGAGNWKASMNIQGGTPGSVNSVFDELDELPMISRISFINEKTFEIGFSQGMDSLSLLNQQAYELSKGVGSPEHVYVSSMDISSVILIFSESLENDLIYQLKIADTLYNCAGFPLIPGMITDIGIPGEAEGNDIVINEVLFNPWAGGTDYVEIYNRSDKIIDLQQLSIASIKETYPNPPVTSSAVIANGCYLFFPGEYLLLSKESGIVKDQYFAANPDNFLSVPEFPSLDNEEGRLAILDTDGNRIDYFEFSEKMQFPLLEYHDGVALERINFNRPALDKTNWHSAAEYVGFGTPGYQNSQFAEGSYSTDPVRIDPEIFSPDGDGSKDVMNIHYEFDEPGYVANITIYDAHGNLIRQLVSSELLGRKGFFSWDGLTKTGQLCPIGIYIIYFEVFDVNGIVNRYKKTGVLGGNL